jgi:hypothetical protein
MGVILYSFVYSFGLSTQSELLQQQMRPSFAKSFYNKHL